jgi:hypothetical protein
MPDRYIWMFRTHRDVSELFRTFSKYTPVQTQSDTIKYNLPLSSWNIKRYEDKN